MIKYMHGGVPFCADCPTHTCHVDITHSPSTWNRDVGDQYSALVELPSVLLQGKMSAPPDLRGAMSNSVKNSRRYNTCFCSRPPSCHADPRALLEDIGVAISQGTVAVRPRENTSPEALISKV